MTNLALLILLCVAVFIALQIYRQANKRETDPVNETNLKPRPLKEPNQEVIERVRQPEPPVKKPEPGFRLRMKRTSDWWHNEVYPTEAAAMQQMRKAMNPFSSGEHCLEATITDERDPLKKASEYRYNPDTQGPVLVRR